MHTAFCFFLYFRIFLSFSNYLDPQPPSSCFRSRVAIRASQRNRRFAPEQLGKSNYKTLGKCSADALHRHPPPSSFLPSIWSNAIVLRRLHMKGRSLPSGRCGINEPNCRPTLPIRTKEERAKVVQRCCCDGRLLAWRNAALPTDQQLRRP